MARTKRKRTGDSRGTSVHQLKISLEGIEQTVWRRIRLRSSSTFADLHQVIQTVMGWDDAHLHEFRIGSREIGMPDEESPKTEDESDFRLNELLPEPNAKFVYAYDFGDGWQHQVVVEAIEPAAAKESLPKCLAGERACPPEDCGGVGGYEDLLEALNDPANERHDELSEWVGSAFDPERFDLAAVNDRLERLFGKRGKRSAKADPLLECAWCKAMIRMKDEVFSLPLKTWDKVDLKPLQGEWLGVSTTYHDDLVPVFVLPKDAPARKEGNDLVFMLCSELCTAKLQEALAQGAPAIVH